MDNLERIYVCVDDTDDLTKSTSTGTIADAIAQAVEKEYDSKLRIGITRHQLFLDPSVPYTSHNSSMCFDMLLPSGSAARVDEIGWEIIRKMRAPSANPGLCVLASDVIDEEQIRARYRDLIRFGQEAKIRYVTHEEAAEMTRDFPEILLKWDGETGQGRIGALAGVGLRISGNDGRFRGKYHLKGLCGKKHLDACELSLLCEKEFGTRPVFADEKGQPLDPQETVQLTDDVKPVFLDGQMVMLCGRSEDGCRIPLTKDSLPKKHPGQKKKKDLLYRGDPVSCPYFEPDPDEEERFHENRPNSCGSCLYRRLEPDGYSCSKGVTDPLC